MNPKNTKYYTVVILSLIITSCTKDVANLKLPDFEQKLAINSFISPDLTVNELTINCNMPVFGKLSPPEAPGKVTILLSNGIDELRIDTTLRETRYQNKIRVRNLPVTAGKSFKIKVESEMGLTAEASCYVPVRRNFHIQVDTTKLLTKNQYNGNTYSSLVIKVSITDFPGEPNYYRILISGKSYGNTSVDELRADFDEGDLVFSDKGRDGKKFVLRTLTCYSKSIESVSTTDSSFLKIYLLNTDKAYYDFHQSLLTHQSGEDPFSEPAPFYSNVSSGTGILASYTVDSLIFRVK